MDLADAELLHADLFAEGPIEALRRGADSTGEEGERNRALLAFATDGYLQRTGAALADQIATAENRAVIHWRGEPIAYPLARDRISATGDRAERNGLFGQWLRAVEAINPLRIARFEALEDAVRDLGYVDRVEMVRRTRGCCDSSSSSLATSASFRSRRRCAQRSISSASTVTITSTSALTGRWISSAGRSP